MAGVLQARGRIWTPRGPAITSSAGAGAHHRRGGGRPLAACIGAKLAPSSLLDEHVPGLADDDHAAALVERARGQADADAGRNALPGLAAVGAAHDVAAQAVGDDDAVLADEAEQRARVRRASAPRSARRRGRA